MSQLRKLQQNKTLIIAGGVVALLVVIGLLVILTSQGHKKRPSIEAALQEASSDELADQNIRFKQTLAKEKIHRDDQQREHDANKNYKKLAW